MKYIKSLHIVNFQSHKNTIIDLDKGLNIFVGESDQGKSSIIRALRWLFYNEPRGTGFIRVGESSCEVTAVLDEGTKVTRFRDEGKRQNRYIITYPDGRELILEKFGSDLPLEVQAELGVYPLWVDNDLKLELNIARQLESPFLLENSPANRAKIIGRIANLHIIDAAQRDLLKDIRNLGIDKSNIEAEIDNLKKEKKDYADIPIQEKQLALIKGKLEKIQVLKEKYDKLGSLKTDRENLSKRINDNQAKLSSLENLEIMQYIYNKSLAKANYFYELLAFQHNFLDLSKALAENSEIVQKLNKLDDAQNVYRKTINLYSVGQDLKEINDARKQVIKRFNEGKQLLQATSEITKGDKIIVHLYGLREEGFKLQEIRKIGLQLNNDIKTKQKQLLDVGKQLNRLSGIEKAQEIIKKQNTLSINLRELLVLNEERRDIVNKLKVILKNIKEIDENYKKLQAEFIDLLSKAGTCPTCSSKITAAVIDKIADNTAIY